MSDLNEIKKIAEEGNRKIEELRQKSASKDDLADVVRSDEVKKIQEAVAADLLKEQESRKALEAKLTDLETAMSRPGTGGGGSPYHKLLNVRELYRQGKRVTLIDPMSLADDALVAILSNMGAPLVGQERLADAAFALKPLKTMERYLGREFDAVMSLEIGGGNGVHPLMVAALAD